MNVLETIREGERELKTAHADMFTGKVSPLYVDKLITSQTIALLKAQNVELEGRKWINPEVDRLCVNGHTKAIQDTIEINNKLIKELRVINKL